MLNTDKREDVVAFMQLFKEWDVFKFAMKFRELGNLDVKIIEYLNSLPMENYEGVSDTRVFRGNFSDLARAIKYKDAPNVRKSCMRLDDFGVLWVKRKGRNVEEIILSKYWMIKIFDKEEE